MSSLAYSSGMSIEDQIHCLRLVKLDKELIVPYKILAYSFEGFAEIKRLVLKKFPTEN